MTHFRVQVYKQDEYDTLIGMRWHGIWTEIDDLKEARDFYKEIWMDNPQHDVRLVKAFWLDDGVTEKVTAVLEFKKGKSP